MKKIILILIFIAISNILFAQDRKEGGFRVGPWTSWSSHSCFKGIYWRIRKQYYYDNGNNDKFINEYEIKNQYSRKVSFSFGFTADNSPNTNSGRKTLNSGESYKNVTLQYETRAIRLNIESVCFEYYNSNGTVLENCSSDPETYKKDFYYAECDNASPNYKKFTKGTKPPGNTQNSSSNSNSTSQSSMQDLLNKWNELCQKSSISENPTVRSANSRSCLSSAQNYEDNDANRRMITAKIKDLETALATDKDYESKQDAAKKAEVERAKAEEERLNAASEVWKQKTADFSQLINEGDAELGNNNYDAAILKYNQAKIYIVVM